MYSHLVFRWKLWGLHRKVDANNKKYIEAKKQDERLHKEICSKFDASTSEDEKRTYHENRKESLDVINERVEGGNIQLKIQLLVTRELLSNANRLMVEVPGRTEADCWNIRNDYSTLTRKGISTVRKTIREEKNDRAKHLLAWSGGIVGVIGALTGLVAVILK